MNKQHKLKKNNTSQYLLIFISILAFSLINCRSDRSDPVAGKRGKKVKTYSLKETMASLSSSKVKSEKWSQFGDEVIVSNEQYAYYDDARPNKLTYDLYGPDVSDNEKRPLIIFVHSGGFLIGSKENYLMGELSRDFARAGFYTAKINYRDINFKDYANAASMLWSKDYSRKSIYNSLRDLREAVKFFVREGTQWGIDTDKIYVAGYSSGGILALHLALSDDKDLEPCPFFGTAKKDLGCLDCLGDNSSDFKSSIKGVISISGAVFNNNHIHGDDRIPLLLIHGTEDDMVSIGNEEPFQKFKKDYDFELPGFYYELGVKKKNDNKVEEWTRGGVKVEFKIPGWMSDKIISVLTPELYGPETIHRNVISHSTFVKIKGGNHVFMKGEDGVLNKGYDIIRKEMLEFIDHTSDVKKGDRTSRRNRKAKDTEDNQQKKKKRDRPRRNRN